MVVTSDRGFSDEMTPDVAWEQRVCKALGASLPFVPTDDVFRRGVEETLLARKRYDRARNKAHSYKRRPSEVLREKHKAAKKIRDFIRFYAELDLPDPPIPAPVHSKQGRLGIHPADAKIGRRAVASRHQILLGLESAAQGLEDWLTHFVVKVGHRTPASLKWQFVAELLFTWSRVRDELISEVRIGAADYEERVLAFLAAAVMPLNGKNGRRLIPVATMRTHARSVQKEARKFGDERFERMIETLSEKTTN